MTREIFVDIVLTAAAAGVGAVAVLVALATIGGWIWFNRAVRKTARETAQTSAEEKMREFISESNIRQMLAEAVAKEANVLYSDMDRSPMHKFGDLAKER